MLAAIRERASLLGPGRMAPREMAWFLNSPNVRRSSLDSISTQWTALQDPAQFAERYGPAVRNYLERLLRNRDDAEDISQEFLVQVVQQGFAGAKQERGKFRHYLKVAVRNAALDFLRRAKE